MSPSFGGIWSIISETWFPTNVISPYGLQHNQSSTMVLSVHALTLDVGILKVSLTLLRIRDNINVPHSSN